MESIDRKIWYNKNGRLVYLWKVNILKEKITEQYNMYIQVMFMI